MGLKQEVCFRSVRIAAAILSLAALRAPAQTTGVAPRITQAVDERELVVLQGNVHPRTRTALNLGAVSDAQPLTRMLLLLKRSPEQESALLRLLDEQQSKSSANYHKWLTPEQFGQQFGPADADIQAVRDWLSAQGFQVTQVTKGRTAIEFSGNVAQARNALHTQIQRYAVNGEERLANASDPQIPAALTPVVAGVVTLHNIPHKSHGHYLGQFRRSLRTGETTPLFTFPRLSGTGNVYVLGPADFAKTYNVAPLWNATPAIDGTGQIIAIVGETNINIQDVRDFRKIFGLPPNDPEIILNGMDPGITSQDEESEADLDVEWSGAVAKGAKIRLVVSASTPVSAGVDLSALYIVENNLASVISESYGDCEQHLTAAENQFYNRIWEQAAAQGITAIVSSGDGGSAGCDDFNTQKTASKGLGVNGMASTPFNIAAGGTDFDQINKWTQYWSATNDPTTQASALSYIPEIPWSENCAQLGLDGCGGSAPQGSVNIIAGSGGASTLYSKPKWQVGVAGMPNDNKRDLPDVSLFASGGFTGSAYIICQQDRNISNIPSCDLTLGLGYLDFHGAGGTSAAAPALAGIMALVDQKSGSRQGNADPILYALAKQANASCDASLPGTITNTGCTFYDVTKGNSYAALAPGVGTNSVPCSGGSPNCSSSTTNVNGVLVDPQATATEAWTAGAGYDMTTGLGSVNAYNLASKWSSVSTIATTSTLVLSPTTGITHGQSENVSVNITVKANSGTGIPGGDVSLIASMPDGTTRGLDQFTLANGAVSGAKTQNLPGGIYNVSAHYAGDGTNAPSDSSPVQVTVAKESSQTFIWVAALDSSGKAIPGNATSLVYGSPYIIRMYVTDKNGAASTTGPPSPACYTENLMTCPTGTVTLTANGAAIDGGAYALNNEGYTRDLVPTLGGGSYPFLANYAGDASYTPSTSATNTLTINPAPTAQQWAAYPSFAVVGQPFALGVAVGTGVAGVSPTGTVQFYDGNTLLPGTVTLNAQGQGSNVVLYAWTSTSLSTGGTHTITAKYSGDANYGPSTSSPVSFVAKYPTALTQSESSTNINYGQSITVTAKATGNSASPAMTGQFQFFGTSTAITGAVTVTSGTDASGNPVLTATVSTTPQYSEQISVSYNGDPNYTYVSTTGDFVTVNIPDFSVAPSNGLNFTVSTGQTATASVTVTPLSSTPSSVALSFNGGTQAVPGFSLTASPATVNLNGAAAIDTITLAPAAGTIAKPANVKQSGFAGAERGGWWTVSGAAGLTALFLLGWPGRRRRYRAALGWGLVCALSFALGCGGGSASGGGGGGGGPVATSVTLTSSIAKLPSGSALTLTAKVNSTRAVTGTVTFFTGGSNFSGAVPLTNGQAQIANFTFLPGVYQITAQYSGDGNNQGSTSAPVTQVLTGLTYLQLNAQTGGLIHSIPVNVTIQ